MHIETQANSNMERMNNLSKRIDWSITYHLKLTLPMRLPILFAITFLQIVAQTKSTPILNNNLEWRQLGPASIGGRISAIEGIPGDPALLYAATGSGGLFRTANAGTTWQAIFERPETISIGDIAIDPAHPDTIFVGTGEANLRNSVSYGSGVYYSPDAGKTWEHRGLRDTYTISRLALDPRNAQRLFVAAVGNPFGPNPERGVFFSPDAGKSWQKVLYTDEHHGASDLEIAPGKPDLMFAGLWNFDRKPWRYDSGDTNGGLYRSTDAGKTWSKITKGLPALLGRIGVKVAPSNPRIVYVVAESKEGTLFRSTDSGESFTAVNMDRELIGRGYYYCDLRIDPVNPDRVYVLSNALMLSTDAGGTFARIGNSVHGDLHALWIDPKNPARIWQGSDGGLAHSWDAGKTWNKIASLSIGQFYHVSADNRTPFYNVAGGTQDNGTWYGPSQTREPAGILNDDWRQISPIVGFHVIANSADPDLVLSQTPGGALLRTNLRTREQQNVSPQVRSYNGQTADIMKIRFGWDAPLARSPHAADTIYYAGNQIFQSSDFGRTWEAISKDLTNNDRSRMKPSGGPIFTDNSSSETYSTITRLIESPAKRGVLWAGTDDGNVQLTINGGGTWTRVSATADSVVSTLEAGHADANRAYVGFDRHMAADFTPHLLRTVDQGKTWKPIVAGLPDRAVVWVVREDLADPNILYCGTELGLYISFNQGDTWLPFHLKNLPNVAVRDIFPHPTRNDILIATHGRGIWVLDDVGAIQHLKNEGLFPIRPAVRYTVRATRAYGGDNEFKAPNAPYGAILNYTGGGTITILDANGSTVRTLQSNDTGRTIWDLRAQSPKGPQVLPGTYTARLTGGSITTEQPVTVTLDPELNVPREALEAQWDALNRLLKLLPHPQAQALFNLIDSANDAPTGAMLKLLAELEATATRK